MHSSKRPLEARADDASLVARCLAGDTRAFEEIYRVHSTRLYNLARRMVGDDANAEDLLQEIFLLAHRKLQSFKGDSSLATWLYRLGINRCLDHLRSKSGRMDDHTQSLDNEEGSRRSEDVPAPGEMTITRLELEHAIAQLPPGCREVFLLHDVEGFEHREIADLLQIAEGTSKSQVHKARMRLRTLLRGIETLSEPPRQARVLQMGGDRGRP